MSERDRFDKFTERARKVLSFAQEEAQRFQHNYIGTEHLLQKGRQKAPSLESGDEWLSRLHILLMYAIIQTWITNMNNIPYI